MVRLLSSHPYGGDELFKELVISHLPYPGFQKRLHGVVGDPKKVVSYAVALGFIRLSREFIHPGDRLLDEILPERDRHGVEREIPPEYLPGNPVCLLWVILARIDQHLLSHVVLDKEPLSSCIPCCGAGKVIALPYLLSAHSGGNKDLLPPYLCWCVHGILLPGKDYVERKSGHLT